MRSSTFRELQKMHKYAETAKARDAVSIFYSRKRRARLSTRKYGGRGEFFALILLFLEQGWKKQPRTVSTQIPDER
jgi:hypothetical protein